MVCNGILYNAILVGGLNHLEKYESQWEGLSHIFWKIKVMFQTTTQPLFHSWLLELGTTIVFR